MEDNSASIQKRKKIAAALKLAFLLFVLLGVPALLYVKYGDAFFSGNSASLIIDYLQQHRNVSLPIIMFLQVFQVVVCFIPGQPIQFALSYLFGFVWAIVISVAGAMLGTTISFYMSRALGHDAVNVLFDEEKINNYREKLNSAKAILIVFIIYLVPGIPKDLTSYAAGISDMRFTPFLIASTLGRCPSMFGSILFGYFFKEHNTTGLIILSVVVGIIVLLCFIFRKRIYRYIDSMAEKGISEK